ncbi:MAG: DUF1080 domain-containing protein [Planctomycetia bacterium]|jgi:hypothetical protein
MLRTILTIVLGTTLLLPSLSCGAKGPEKKSPKHEKCPEYTSVADMTPADTADFKIQGEYVGTDKFKTKGAVQVRALGKGKFLLVAYPGGLPGDGWDKERSPKLVELETVDGIVTGTTKGGLKAELKDGKCLLYDPNGTLVVELEKIERKSPTLGAKPPEGAVVLFDGSTNAFKNNTLNKEFLEVGQTSKLKFGDHSLHLEFCTPFTPEARGQKCGNSGCYVLGRYEVQILDSFGLKGESNECGGVYKVAPPKVNMAFPPLTWQTYDIDFTAAKFDENGKKTANARMTVKHNGVLIHDDVEVVVTPGGVSKTDAPTGPLFLQDHHNPVRFRNIWAVPKK